MFPSVGALGRGSIAEFNAAMDRLNQLKNGAQVHDQHDVRVALSERFPTSTGNGDFDSAAFTLCLYGKAPLSRADIDASKNSGRHAVSLRVEVQVDGIGRALLEGFAVSNAGITLVCAFFGQEISSTFGALAERIGNNGAAFGFVEIPAIGDTHTMNLFIGVENVLMVDMLLVGSGAGDILSFEPRRIADCEGSQYNVRYDDRVTNHPVRRPIPEDPMDMTMGYSAVGLSPKKRPRPEVRGLFSKEVSGLRSAPVAFLERRQRLP